MSDHFDIFIVAYFEALTVLQTHDLVVLPRYSLICSMGLE